MYHKLGCQGDNQNCTFQIGRLWWSGLPLKYAAWINLPWKTSGKVEWCYLISTDATQWEHQTGASEWARWRLHNHLRGGWRWLARLSPRLVSAANNALHQRQAPPTPMTTFWVQHSSISFGAKVPLKRNIFLFKPFNIMEKSSGIFEGVTRKKVLSLSLNVQYKYCKQINLQLFHS